MKFLILSLLISAVAGCIPQGFDGLGSVRVDDNLAQCHEFLSRMSCREPGQTPTLSPELHQLVSIDDGGLQGLYLSLIGLSLDQSCCAHQLESPYLVDVAPGYGINVDFDGADVSIGAFVESSESDKAVEGPVEAQVAAAESAPVSDDYALQTVPSSFVARPLSSYFELVRHAVAVEAANSCPRFSAAAPGFNPYLTYGDLFSPQVGVENSLVVVDEIVGSAPSKSVVEEPFDAEEEARLEAHFARVERELRMTEKLISVVGIGFLGLEGVVFILFMLVLASPSDEVEILEALGFAEALQVQTRDAAVQVTPAMLAPRPSPAKQVQTPAPVPVQPVPAQEQPKSASTSSSKSVPAPKGNKKTQLKARTKSAKEPVKKAAQALPQIQENDEVDVCMDDLSSSHA